MTAISENQSPRGAERRKEKRYELKLKGEFGVGGAVIPVEIADVSGSGALISMSDPPATGTVGDLWIAGFGGVEVQVMYSGDNACGVIFTNHAALRLRLLTWLRQEVSPAETATK